MTLRLIVAEKPSVARDIARVLDIRGGGNGVRGSGATRVSWCVGHLAELAEPKSYESRWASWTLDTLPMQPQEFHLQPRKGAIDQWRILRDLLKDPQLSEVINACDAGREGELIFSNVYRLAGCKAPVRRLWISSMTDTAIRRGFDQLRPGAQMRPLEDAARCRSEADWLVGLNATRAMTLKVRTRSSSTLLSLGRVQTPTLALITSREQAIEDFEPETFFQVRVQFTVEEGSWDALWNSPRPKQGKAPPHRDRIAHREDAEAIVARVAGQLGLVKRAERKEQRERHPLLYDLTSLQKEANKRFRFSAKRTLELAQSLYERHKVLTYPRTDSRHLASDQVPGLPDVLSSLRFGPYDTTTQDTLQRWPVKLGKRVVDDGEVSDHHAIIPTGVDPRRPGLDRDEKRVYDLVARRFLAVFQPDAVFATVLLDTHIDQDSFVARGRTCLEQGWRAIDPPLSKKKELLLPPVGVGREARHDGARIKEGQTKPPKRYTEATLLGAMENAGDQLHEAELKRAMKRNGLGTPATRAAIIETLLSRTYVRREGPVLVPTPSGRTLLRLLPVEELRSARLTGSWEARLVAIAEGEEDRAAFMADIRAFVDAMTATIVGMEVPAELRVALAPAAPTDGELLGTCPRCGGEVRRGDRGWRCLGCPLDIPGRVAQREISKRMARALLTQGQTPAVQGFKSRKGKTFTAALKLEGDGVSFDFPDPEELGTCPACGKPVRPRGKVFTCDTGRECPFVVYGEMSGKEIPVEAVKDLLADGRSGLLEGFRTRDGDAFDGVLAWQDGRVRVQRVDKRSLAGPVAPCKRCGGDLQFAGGRYRCRSCDFSLPGAVMQRSLEPQDIRALVEQGRTPRLHGFRQKNGAVCKASLVLTPEGRVELDFRKPAGEAPEAPPPGGPPFALGKRHTCPRCHDAGEHHPGYIIRGRNAWGCSRWRQGCRFQLPFEPLPGVQLSDAAATRLLGKHRASRIQQLPIGIAGARVRGRLLLQPDATPCWRAIEEPRQSEQ